MTIFIWILLRMRNVSDKSCRGNQNTHFGFSNYFLKSRRFWDNVEKYCREGQATDDNTCILRRTRFSCWITKARHTDTPTLRIRNTYCFSATTMVTRPHLSVMLYVHCLPCFKTKPSEVNKKCVEKCSGLLRPCESAGQLFIRGSYFSYS